MLIIAILATTCSLALAQNRKSPPMNGNLPQIADATWAMFNIYDKGKNPPKPAASLPSFVFCKSNNWQMKQIGVGESGVYSVDGNKLSLTYGKTGKPSIYTMTWDATGKVLKLEGATTIMLLEYTGVSNCN